MEKLLKILENFSSFVEKFCKKRKMRNYLLGYGAVLSRTTRIGGMTTF